MVCSLGAPSNKKGGVMMHEHLTQFGMTGGGAPSTRISLCRVCLQVPPLFG